MADVTDADREAAEQWSRNSAAICVLHETLRRIAVEQYAEAIARARAEEREACALLCEAQHGVHRLTDAQEAHYNGTRKCSAAIRARGEQGGK